MNFTERRAHWANKPRKRNESLPAGSPLYYYCRCCGAEMIRPEDHVEAAPRVCPACTSEGRKEPE